MEKEKFDFKLDYYLDWVGEVEISKLKRDIEELEKLGATHIEVEHGVSYDCSYVDINAFQKRLETDEEFELRKKAVKEREEKIKQSELKQLETLRQKYNI
jgi:hypothetical protein